MENFVVSARKYRPQTFDSVVGQEHITTTLKNAIKNNQLAQAFLFCGPRGVGKTTCARILAKTICCTNRTENIEACGVCPSCQSFQNNASLTIHELDAASNNSVDDIRNVIEQVRYPPQVGSHKVYVIDEVHMLSSGAFNAFLKTLEEPPPYAIFILATTEKHKILPTVLSRCQIFDFNRIGIQDMTAHLAGIAANEKIQAEPDALHVISQKSEGCLRDALSIFDLVTTYSKDRHITYGQVIENLNVLDYDYYFRAVDGFVSESLPEGFLLFDEILQKGFDAQLFVQGLMEHLRNLIMCRYPKTVSLLEVPENVQSKYASQAQNCGSSFLLSALNVAHQTEVQLKTSKNPRLTVELLIMKLTHIKQALQVQQVATTDEKKSLN